MSSHLALGIAASAIAMPHRVPLGERRLRRFPGTVNARVRTLAESHPRLADLAVSFPALLFALAVPRVSFDPAPLIAKVIAGAPLDLLAAMAGVPLWLRRLMPEAFVRPLPLLPGSAPFRLQIANHLPRSPKLAPVWLETVAEAAQLAGEPFAIWLAREMVRGVPLDALKRLRLVALWAWVTTHEDAVAGAFADTPWAASMRYATALEAAQRWRELVTLHLSLGAQPIADMWLTAGSAGGYEFRPLATEADIRAEAAAMRNCLATYGQQLRLNRTRLWSVRQGDQSIATLEVRPRYGDRVLAVWQLNGPDNTAVSDDVWQAARRWLLAHDLAEIRPEPRPWGSVGIDRSRWIALWRPYWRARRRIPDWLPLAPSLAPLGAL